MSLRLSVTQRVNLFADWFCSLMDKSSEILQFIYSIGTRANERCDQVFELIQCRNYLIIYVFFI